MQRIGNRHLLTRLWLAVVFFGLLVTAIELIEHNEPGMPFLQNTELLREAAIFGLALPLLMGILLTLLVRAKDERDEAVVDLHSSLALSKKLNNVLRSDDLLAAIVEFPQTIVPTVRTYLNIYKPEQDKFELAAFWPKDGGRQVGDYASCAADECCTNAKYLNSVSQSPAPCEKDMILENGHHVRRYCLPLRYADSLVGTLHMDLEEKLKLTGGQVNSIESLAPEMAMAIESVYLKEDHQHSIEATVAERQRIARDLHDTLGQNVSFLRLKLDQLSSDGSLEDIAGIRQELEHMRDIANEAADQFRATLDNLRPECQSDLAMSLRDRAIITGNRAGFAIQLDVAGEPVPLDPQVHRQVLFICREILNNVEKHAGAQLVKFSLSWAKDELKISIKDDGRGFELDKLDCDDKIGKHYGMAIMWERVQAIDGDLTIVSNPGVGTEVIVKVPLFSNPSAAAYNQE